MAKKQTASDKKLAPAKGGGAKGKKPDDSADDKGKVCGDSFLCYSVQCLIGLMVAMMLHSLRRQWCVIAMKYFLKLRLIASTSSTSMCDTSCVKSIVVRRKR